MLKRAFITGVSGQDGSYLAELLHEKGYEVYGLVRPNVSDEEKTVVKILEGKVFFHEGDLSDGTKLKNLIEEVRPQEIYHLGAYNNISFDDPLHSADINGISALRLLEIVRRGGYHEKFLFASSAQIFGDAPPPQNENTALRPLNPYAAAKAFGQQMVANYRREFGLHASSVILFNHESPRRAPFFVTRKISFGVAEILAGRRKSIELGDLEAVRDWGYAPEYADAMWQMVQASEPDDYVLATGEPYTVREFVIEAFRIAGIKDWEKYIITSSQHMRSREANYLLGDATKIKEKLGWEPKIKFKDIVRIMVTADCERLGIGL